jgi:hypothetical protein
MGVLTAKDYEHAESFLSYNTDPFIDRASVRPNGLPAISFGTGFQPRKATNLSWLTPLKKHVQPL